MKRVSIMDVNRTGDDSALAPEDAALLARRRAVLGERAPLLYRQPLHIVRGEGVHLYDNTGRRYLDFYNNVASLGHSHPKVVEATAAQLGTLSTHSRYLHAGVVDYSERVLGTFPPAINRAMYTCTGSEANDLAVRLARHATGATGVIVTEAAYHGNTDLVSQLSPSSWRNPADAPDWLGIVPTPSPHRIGSSSVGEQLGKAVVAEAQGLFARGHNLAALLVDTVFSSDGIHTDPPGFLRPAIAAVRKLGGLVIADEVQPGFGRTGAGLWGFSRHGFEPDIVTVGKPMGNGYPVGAVFAHADHADAFAAEHNYFNTFAGSPVAFAAASAVMDVIESEGLQAHALALGERLRHGLIHLASQHRRLGAVRGVGLFVGVDILDDNGDPSTSDTVAFINALRDRGVLVSACGSYAETVKIRPPLVCTSADVDRFLSECDQVAHDLSSRA